MKKMSREPHPVFHAQRPGQRPAFLPGRACAAQRQHRVFRQGLHRLDQHRLALARGKLRRVEQHEGILRDPELRP